MKALELELSLQAGTDILEQSAWYESRAGERLSSKWENAVASTLIQLYMHPHSGALHKFKNNEISDIRRMRVSGFPKHLVFYKADDEKLQILRVLHGARDLESLF